MLNRLRNIRARYPFFEPAILGGVMLLWLMVSAFWELADDVGEGDTHELDTRLLMMLRDGNHPQNALGPPWVEEIMRDISGLGGIAILTMVTLGAGLYLFMMKKTGQAAYLVVSVTIGTLLSNILKSGFGRPRPDLVPHGSYVFTNSFPSGHSMMSTLVYLSVGALLARAHSSYGMKIYFLGTSIILAIAIGISRVYLGVHWPSDVMAGWLIGGAGAVFFWLVEWAWTEKVWRNFKRYFP